MQPLNSPGAKFQYNVVKAHSKVPSLESGKQTLCDYIGDPTPMLQMSQYKKPKVPFCSSALSDKTHYKSQMASGQTPVWTITGFSFPTSVQPSKRNTLSFTVLDSCVLIKHLFKNTKHSTRLQCTLEIVGFRI